MVEKGGDPHSEGIAVSRGHLSTLCFLCKDKEGLKIRPSDPSPLPSSSADPIAQVHQAFCKNLLERAVESLVKPQAKKKAGEQEEESW